MTTYKLTRQDVVSKKNNVGGENGILSYTNQSILVFLLAKIFERPHKNYLLKMVIGYTKEECRLACQVNYFGYINFMLMYATYS